MRMRDRGESFDNKRLLDADEIAIYLGLGKVRARKFAEDNGALRRYGKRVLFDRFALDRAIDDMAAAK